MNKMGVAKQVALLRHAHVPGVTLDHDLHKYIYQQALLALSGHHWTQPILPPSTRHRCTTGKHTLQHTWWNNQTAQRDTGITLHFT